MRSIFMSSMPCLSSLVALLFVSCVSHHATAQTTVAIPVANADTTNDGNVDFDDVVQLDAIATAIGPFPNPDGTYDNFDVNRDGVLDAQDSSDAIALIDPYMGDINLDGTVDSSDLGVLLLNFGSTSVTGWTNGDLDFNSTVDSTDLGLFLSTPIGLAGGNATRPIP